jgi:isocitrate dehydrogenase (NAD+)
MLRHLGEQEAADRILRALEIVYAERKHLTRDVSGTASTNQFADAVIAVLENAPSGISAPASGKNS